MAKITSTIWPIDNHTQAKHIILENHLKAWFPILGSKFGRVVYLDGFAGPGLYSKGEEGSPVIAIKTVEEHVMKKKFGDITFIFVEKDTKRANKLEEVIRDKFPKLPSNLSYEIRNDEFVPSIEGTLDALEEQKLKLAPTFAFIDPFGYTEFPMKTIARLLSNQNCEVLITFMIDFVVRFESISESALDKLFGTSEWKEEFKKAKTPSERKKFFIDFYQQQLKKIANVRFTRSFEMVRGDGNTVYYLVFGTNHPLGMRVIKDAMYKADERGTFRFSDREDPTQTFLGQFDETDFWIPDASKQVFEQFKGTKVPVIKVKEFIITNTIFKYKAGILEHLETSDPPKIVNVIGRKLKTFNYPDRCTIEFST